jgi:hypothetical protein
MMLYDAMVANCQLVFKSVRMLMVVPPVDIFGV